jgi:hypothetical protein
MKNKPVTNTHMYTQTQTAIKAKSIKLGIDVHADSYRVVRQIDHATPQPSQRFSSKEFLRWAQKQLTSAAIGRNTLEIHPKPRRTFRRFNGRIYAGTQER